MFEKEATEYATVGWDKSQDPRSMFVPRIDETKFNDWRNGAEYGYNKANEWHYVKDGDLPRQDGNTCFSIEVLASNKKWVYYQFNSGKWFCGNNKEVKVIAWKEIVLPELKEIE